VNPLGIIPCKRVEIVTNLDIEKLKSKLREVVDETDSVIPYFKMLFSEKMFFGRIANRDFELYRSSKYPKITGYIEEISRGCLVRIEMKPTNQSIAGVSILGIVVFLLLIIPGNLHRQEPTGFVNLFLFLFLGFAYGITYATFLYYAYRVEKFFKSYFN
jgi:hypothetical protein